jgi:hypothetical protein
LDYSFTKNSHNKIVLKIYFDDVAGFTVLEENPEITLKEILHKMIKKDDTMLKNLDYYSFLEHCDDNKDKNFFDDEMNLETQLKYLSNFELDVILLTTAML